MSDAHRECRTCHMVKHIEQFRKYYEGVYRRSCLECTRAQGAARKREVRKDPNVYEQHLARTKKWRTDKPESYRKHRIKKREKHKSQYFGDLSFRCRQIITAASRRAAKKGLAFELDAKTLEAIINVQGFKCSVTGTVFDLSASDKYLRSPLAPSIDRRDSDRGYTWDNIQVVAAWYNIFKNEWSDEDAKEFIAVAYRTMFGE